MTIAVHEGAPAPDFELKSDSGRERAARRNCAGKPVVLYFYPKDDTPGCTKQACGIRDAGARSGDGRRVFGVSPDSEASHAKFKEKYGLPFTLLADPDHEVTEQYGFWVEKSFAGKKHMGVERSTVVIGDGRHRRKGLPAGQAGRARRTGARRPELGSSSVFDLKRGVFLVAAALAARLSRSGRERCAADGLVEVVVTLEAPPLAEAIQRSRVLTSAR